ncbi:MAG: ThiF family adenylyltransferase [Pseudomonadota bacterium]
MHADFDYGLAFSRNTGWVTRDEQTILRHKRIAIAGMGGVGGSHLLTLTRLGVGAFHIADFDHFELANFNRQAGAACSTLQQPKAEVLARLARDIHPELDLRIFPDGVTTANLPAFLDGVDLYVDGLDFFAMDIRRAVFAACAEAGIPAITAAPLGMGAALLSFLPGGMSFEDYFRLEGQPEDEQLLRFLLGLSPAMLQRGYLVDPDAVDLARHRGPSTPMACELCAGVAATQALKLLLHRGKALAAPYGLHFDAYRNRLVKTWRPGGNHHPVQRLALHIARKQFGVRDRVPPAPPSAPRLSTAERILNLARWAPSGDNTQPWRFEIRDPRHVVIHGFDTRDHVVYDLQGHASQIALGALLETLTIAASGEQLSVNISRRPDMPDTHPTFDVTLGADMPVSTDPLLPYIRVRCTQRRALSTRPLTRHERAALQTAVKPNFHILWLDHTQKKIAMARLTSANAAIRLTIPEAFEVHRRVIEWRSRFSPDRIPDQAVGLDPFTTRLMEWTLQKWQRVTFLNRYLAGTLMPRLQLDVIPALRCAAHFVIVAQNPPQGVADYVSAGRAVQRFWLTATQQGLHVQPEMTPLIFADYVRKGLRFTQSDKGWARARRVSRQLEGVIGVELSRRAVFMGRIGAGPAPTARSTRKSLEELMIDRS